MYLHICKPSCHVHCPMDYTRVTLIVSACQLGWRWEEMANLRGNLRGIIQNEVSLGGSPTINVTLDHNIINYMTMNNMKYYIVIIIKITSSLSIIEGVPCQHVKEDEERLKRQMARSKQVAVLTKIEPSSWMYKYGVRWTQSLESFGRQANVSYMVTMLKENVMIT